MGIKIVAVVNQSTMVTADEAGIMAAAVNRQVYQDYCEAWEAGPVLVQLYPTLEDVPQARDVGVIVIADNADQAGALGWHSEDGGGRIFGFVFAGPVLGYGGAVLLDPSNPETPTVSSVLSHEVLELIADPSVGRWSDGPSIAQGSEYAIEVCDPVEAAQYQIDIENVGSAMVSNFVFPAWFDRWAPEGEQLDYLGQCKSPFTLAPGGYMVVRQGPGSERQVFAATGERRPWRKTAPAAASRTNRRRRAA